MKSMKQENSFEEEKETFLIAQRKEFYQKLEGLGFDETIIRAALEEGIMAPNVKLAAVKISNEIEKRKKIKKKKLINKKFD